MSRGSGELWGCPLMPSQIMVDFLLPTGILLTFPCPRDADLGAIKDMLFSEARNYPLFKLLSEASTYIFVSITQDAEHEEFFDETRRLCDLHLFQPMLRLVEPQGNRVEKMLNYQISIATGVHFSELNQTNDLEVMTFRRNILTLCKETIEGRGGDKLNGKNTKLYNESIYRYPPDIVSSENLPEYLDKKLNSNKEIFLCVWIVQMTNEKSKYTLKVPSDIMPQGIIAEAIRKQTISMAGDCSPEFLCKYQGKFLLKVCGTEEYLLNDYPIYKYKYIQKCLSQEIKPQLTLIEKPIVYQELTSMRFSFPSYVKRGQSAYFEMVQRQTINISEVNDMFKVKINSAAFLSVRESGRVFVRVGLYHGIEPLCPVCCTDYVDPTNPKWDQWLNFDIYISDIPRSARLCIALCFASKKAKKKDQYSLAWANLNLFDFHHRLLSDKIKLNFWNSSQGTDELLNLTGVPGSNPHRDCCSLEIEFDKFRQPITHASEEEIVKQWEWLQETGVSMPNDHLMLDAEEAGSVTTICALDSLSDLTEQDKERLWKNRHFCLRFPTSLPKLLASVKWNCRDDVVMMYLLLKDWKLLPIETALELLNFTFFDLRIRQFATSCLRQTLTDDQIMLYMPQLVQCLKFEPYLDNDLAKFLLCRALMNQAVGHRFFWVVRSELYHSSVRIRFGLILEAFLRSCGSLLKNLVQQVESLEKLHKLTEQLKVEKEEDYRNVLHRLLSQSDYVEKLEHLQSPLSIFHQLGNLHISECRVMVSKKRPLYLVWKNLDPMAEVSQMETFKLIFKCGDDLRQDMLSLQAIQIMDRIWKEAGHDFKMLPYGCIATGHELGVIEVVQRAKTVMAIQKGMQVGSGRGILKWIEKNAEGLNSAKARDNFTRSCAGYCVATFILGIGDRHPDNIMVTEDGQVFHIDFGHFLNHRKKKLGINRERVPFVLPEDFIKVIKCNDRGESDEILFTEFAKLCGKAYLLVRAHATLFITLFSLMLNGGIAELGSYDDIGYLKKTLAIDSTEERALTYFNSNFQDAYQGNWATKIDWLSHWLKNKKSTKQMQT